jgi:hypothetical protein
LRSEEDLGAMGVDDFLQHAQEAIKDHH